MENIKKDLTPEVKQEAKDEMVSVSKETLSALMDRLSRLEKGGTTIKPRRVTEKTAFVRVFEGKPVVDFKKTFTKRNEDNKEILMAKFIVDNNGKQEEVEQVYLDFLNNCPAEQVKIVKQEADEKEINQGTVRPLDEATDRFKDSHVELIVKTVDYMSEVEFLGGDLVGKTIKVPNKVLNM